MPSSKLKEAIAEVLKEEGYILDYVKTVVDNKVSLKLSLKYYDGFPVIHRLKRVSTPGCRIYKKWQELPKVLGGLGIALISTSKGLMTDRNARLNQVGGEVLCILW